MDSCRLRWRNSRTIEGRRLTFWARAVDVKGHLACSAADDRVPGPPVLAWAEASGNARAAVVSDRQPSFDPYDEFLAAAAIDIRICYADISFSARHRACVPR